MYFDEQGSQNVAEEVLKECFFVTQPKVENDRVSDSKDAKPCCQNGIEPSEADDIVEKRPSLWAERRKGQSRMAMVMSALAHMETLKKEL